MKLIDEKEVIDDIADYGCSVANGTGEIEFRYIAEKGFESGIIYAETKLSDLAIEFAEWIESMYRKYSNMPIWYNKGTDINYTTEQLFKIFINERKAKLNSHKPKPTIKG